MEPVDRTQLWRVINHAVEQGLVETVGKVNGRTSKLRLK